MHLSEEDTSSLQASGASTTRVKAAKKTKKELASAAATPPLFVSVTCYFCRGAHTSSDCPLLLDDFPDAAKTGTKAKTTKVRKFDKTNTTSKAKAKDMAKDTGATTIKNEKESTESNNGGHH